jgi:hypothetical protein
MYLDIYYIYIHSKSYVPIKVKRLGIWDGLVNKAGGDNLSLSAHLRRFLHEEMIPCIPPTLEGWVYC